MKERTGGSKNLDDFPLGKRGRIVGFVNCNGIRNQKGT
jgi:hypothetical protein